jgi:hypothetical protein
VPQTNKSRRARRDEIEHADLEAVGSALARLRARFAGDPGIPSRVLSEAWTSPTGAVEDDEAELVDLIADCLSVGLPLSAALLSWTSGNLAVNDDDDGDVEISPFAEIRVRGRGRRIVVG